MRRSVLIFVIANLALISLWVLHIRQLIALLLDDGLTDAIGVIAIPLQDASIDNQQPQVIPKIIHQTYKNEMVPDVWRVAQQSCLDKHPDYKYILWTDEKARNFISAEYPWFLETFDGYEYPIQRSDAIRYFILAHYGGVYIDLDDGCNRRLDELLKYPAWVRRTVPTGISNDVMGSIPDHPFFNYVIQALQEYNRTWPLPYITVMYSTGPLFLSVLWKRYVYEVVNTEERVHVLTLDAYNQYPWSFFSHHIGNSWHGKDAKLVFWMGQHWLILTFCGLTLAGLGEFLLWRVSGWMKLLVLGRCSWRWKPPVITCVAYGKGRIVPTRACTRLKRDEETGRETNVSGKF